MPDPDLQALMRAQPNPFERIGTAQRQAQALYLTARTNKWTVLFLKTCKRFVVLECGHFTVTRFLFRAKCARCGEMIRSGFDHDAFRHHHVPDTFQWPDDPLRELHEGREV
ncbi:hypothetical protein ACMHYO_11715 [Allopusillimonas ginsengisoli]|uniref:hypothetical protein n=1 Tax=Allopusillimonas ginsengisoli TaxID=453575 RepID=UPI0039C037E2